MNLEKLEKNFENACSNLDMKEMVEKSVIYAEACQQKRKYDSAISCLKKLLPRVDKEKRHKAIVLTALGTAYWEKAQLKKALSNFEEALQLFRELGDKAGKATVLFIVGVTYWRKCEWDRALQILENALNDITGNNQNSNSKNQENTADGGNTQQRQVDALILKSKQQALTENERLKLSALLHEKSEK